MNFRPRGCNALSRFLAVVLLTAGAATSACNSAQNTDPSPLEQAGMYFNDISQLREMKMNKDEIAQLAQARQAGLTDSECIALMDLARRHKQPFDQGDTIAGLLRAGFQKTSLMTLVQLDQLNLLGEAQVLKLAGLSDDVIVALAMRRSAGLPTLSGAKMAELRNVQLSNAQILEAVNRGTTDAQADAIIASRGRGTKGFVRQSGSRRRR